MHVHCMFKGCVFIIQPDVLVLWMTGFCFPSVLRPINQQDDVVSLLTDIVCVFLFKVVVSPSFTKCFEVKLHVVRMVLASLALLV